MLPEVPEPPPAALARAAVEQFVAEEAKPTESAPARPRNPNLFELRHLPKGTRFTAPGTARRGQLLDLGSWGAKVKFTDKDGNTKTADWALGTEVLIAGPAFDEDWARRDDPVASSPEGGEGTVREPGERGKRYDLLGFPVTAVMRRLGKEGWDLDRVKRALAAMGVACSDSTTSIQVRAGAKGDRGEPAALTKEQLKLLSDAADPPKEEKSPEKPGKSGGKKKPKKD